jgi:hypothetical protein
MSSLGTLMPSRGIAPAPMKPTPVTIRAATRRLLLQAAMGGHRTRLPPLLLEGDRRAEQQRVEPSGHDFRRRDRRPAH